MKKKLSVIPAILLIVCAVAFSGCSKKPDLYNIGLEYTVQMEELVKNDDYAELYLPAHYNSYRKDFIANDYDTPIKTYTIEMGDKTALAKDISEIEEEKWNGLPEIVKEKILNDLSMQAIAMRVNSYMGGVDLYTFTMNYTIIKQLDKYSLESEIAYLYIFETGKPIIVIYTPCHNGIKVTAQFLTIGEETSLSALREIFEPLNCSVKVLN